MHGETLKFGVMLLHIFEISVILCLRLYVLNVYMVQWHNYMYVETQLLHVGFILMKQIKFGSTYFSMHFLINGDVLTHWAVSVLYWTKYSQFLSCVSSSWKC